MERSRQAGGYIRTGIRHVGLLVRYPPSTVVAHAVREPLPNERALPLCQSGPTGSMRATDR